MQCVKLLRGVPNLSVNLAWGVWDCLVILGWAGEIWGHFRLGGMNISMLCIEKKATSCLIVIYRQDVALGPLSLITQFKMTSNLTFPAQNDQAISHPPGQIDTQIRHPSEQFDTLHFTKKLIKLRPKKFDNFNCNFISN